jgi:hypothetical protein
MRPPHLEVLEPKPTEATTGSPEDPDDFDRRAASFTVVTAASDFRPSGCGRIGAVEADLATCRDVAIVNPGSALSNPA